VVLARSKVQRSSATPAINQSTKFKALKQNLLLLFFDTGMVRQQQRRHQKMVLFRNIVNWHPSIPAPPMKNLVQRQFHKTSTLVLLVNTSATLQQQLRHVNKISG
jgi:hypothetical protein